MGISSERTNTMSGELAEIFYITPRNISPWSSKATSIASVCGLKEIQRIERGRAVLVRYSELIPQNAAFRDVLFDRMTENFGTEEPDLSQMFAIGQPFPLEVIDLSEGTPIEVLKAYNKERGLALDLPEMEYLVEAYKKVGRVSLNLSLSRHESFLTRSHSHLMTLNYLCSLKSTQNIADTSSLMPIGLSMDWLWVRVCLV